VNEYRAMGRGGGVVRVEGAEEVEEVEEGMLGESSASSFISPVASGLETPSEVTVGALNRFERTTNGRNVDAS